MFDFRYIFDFLGGRVGYVGGSFLFFGVVFSFFFFPPWVDLEAGQKTICLENAATSSWFASFVYFASLFAGACFRVFMFLFFAACSFFSLESSASLLGWHFRFSFSLRVDF